MNIVGLLHSKDRDNFLNHVLLNLDKCSVSNELKFYVFIEIKNGNVPIYWKRSHENWVTFSNPRLFLYAYQLITSFGLTLL